MKISLLIALSLLLSVSANSQGGSKQLPPMIVSMLDHKYPGSAAEHFPGWKLAEVSERELQQLRDKRLNAAHPAFIIGDFDGNGFEDYAVLIWYGDMLGKNEKVASPLSHLIAFLGQNKGYKMIELNHGIFWPERIDPQAKGYKFLTLGKKGETRYDWDTGKRITYVRDIVEAWVNVNGGAAYNELENESYGSIAIRRGPKNQKTAKED